MAPGNNKRKRPERQTSNDEGPGRPSPHRPENLNLAQQNQQYGSGRGGRGGGPRRQSRQYTSNQSAGVNATPVTLRSGALPTPALSQAPPPTVESPAPDESTTATPSRGGSAILQPPVTEESKAPAAPYLYEYLTDDIVDSWQEKGRSKLLETVQGADEFAVGGLLQELIRAALDGRINASEGGLAIRESIALHSEDSSLDVTSLLLNSISLLDDSDAKNSNLLTLLVATKIDPETIRQELDIPLLQSLSLVRSTFTQIRARKTTNILYRQANFNLLREETEGYAKLVTEYFNTCNESCRDPKVSAEQAFQRIKALVGSFDLDVGRVLDITLDISANLLVRAYGFIVKFYRCSSWWPESAVLDNVKWKDQGFGSFPLWALPEPAEDLPGHKGQCDESELAAKRDARDVQFWQRVRDNGLDAFFELGAREIVDYESVLPLLETEIPPKYDAKGKEIDADRRKRINGNRKYMKDTKTLPPAGNSDAAQLLGFKLQFYASDARSDKDALPDNLIYLAALLIKIGFISLRDLYPHLYPVDEKMADEKSRLEKEKAEKEAKERPGAGTNALAMAGALTDDTLPVRPTLRSDKGKSGGSTPKPEVKDAEVKDELPSPANQKIMLLKALLLIGCLPEALYMLGRFPWLVDVDTSLPPYLHRIANQMLSKVADSVRPLQGRGSSQTADAILSGTTAKADGTLGFEAREIRKPTRWLGLDQVDKGDGLAYRHYYPDWDDNIPLCQGVEDVILLCNSFLGYLGVKIGQDVKLLGTLVRVAKHSLTKEFSKPNRERWLELMRRLLVPALSLSRHNPDLTQEVYELLKFFPTPTRYNIYAEWYTGKTSRLPDMRVAFDHNRAEIKDVLRRVTNESGKKQARALAKISISSPGIVVNTMISQLESYSNMIPGLVEGTRYFSFLAYDVLNWALINALSGRGRDRIQADGMLTSAWLQALAQFIASLYHTYSALNLSPVLQYLASELRTGNSTDLEVLEQLLAEMGGIRSDIEFNDAQVLAMSGGELLQAQIVAQLADKRLLRRKDGTAPRLVKSLERPGLIGQTLVAIAQERQMYSHHESSKYMPLKVLGNNLDKIQSVFIQYLEVLRTNLKPSEFEAAVPDIISLISEFGLEPGVAFTMSRFILDNAVAEADAAKEQEEQAEKKLAAKQGKTSATADVEMQDDKLLANGDQPVDIVDNAVDQNSDLEDSEAVAAPRVEAVSMADKQSPWHPVLKPIIERLSLACPDLAERVSMPFFVTFWTLSLQNVLVHTESYGNETSKLKAMIKDINNTRVDTSSSAARERGKKKKELTSTMDKLSAEVKSRITPFQRTRSRFKDERLHYFPRSTEREPEDTRNLALLQECFLPRAMMSSLDAHYAFIMLKMLHEFGTPGFNTMRFIGQLMKKQELAAIMFQCTATEAQHFGRFLFEILKLLAHWHADQATYEKEAHGEKQKLPGFARDLYDDGEPRDHVDFEDFRRLLYNWHAWLSAALQLCFESGEYMHIRNGIIVLKSVVPVFPALNFMGGSMVKLVTKISQEDTRQDLKLAAMSLLGPLRNREKKWMMPQAFRLNDQSKDAVKSEVRPPSALPEIAPDSAAASKLNATAPDFKPTTLTNGDGAKEAVAGVEDGEIDDEKTGSVEITDQVMPDVLSTKLEDQAPVAQNEEKVEAKEASVSSQRDVKDSTSVGAQPSASQDEATKFTSSKPTTPAPSEPPSRPLPAIPSAAAHTLPSRPEPRSQPPNKPLPALPTANRGSGRYGRPDDKYGRLDRPGDFRPGSREQSPGRSRPRTPERDGYRGPPANSQPSGDTRHARDGQWAGPRHESTSNVRAPPQDSRGRDYDRERVNSTAPPSHARGLHPDRTGHLSSVIAVQPPSRSEANEQRPIASATNSNMYHENPERLARIQDDTPGSRSDIRDAPAYRDLGRDRPSQGGPNGQSFGQHDIRGPQPLQEPPRASRNRFEPQGDLAPTGPRSGRLSKDFGPQSTPAESSYGRLGQTQDAPMSARYPERRNERGAREDGAQQMSHIRADSQSMSSPSMSRPPESPASFRGPPSQPQAAERRGPDSRHERQMPSSSQPSTPVTENGPPVHPSRMNQLSLQPPLPINTDVGPNGPQNATSSTSVPPSGPRAPNGVPAGAPTGPSPTVATPPSGPASNAERQIKSERQRMNINATLQRANGAPNGQSVSFRGAAQNRQASSTMPPPSIPQPPQAIASSIDPPPRRNDQPPVSMRQEWPSSRPTSRPELFDSAQKRPDQAHGYENSRPPRPDDYYSQSHSDSRQHSRERPVPNDQFARGAPSGMSSSTSRDPSANDMRRSYNERDRRDGADYRAPERSSRNNDMPPQRPPPPQTPPLPLSQAGPGPSWNRGPSDVRAGPRDVDGMYDRRGGAGWQAGPPPQPSRPEPFRNGGRRDDMAGPPPPRAMNDRSVHAGQKRRHEDAVSFEENRRRRTSGRDGR